MSATPPREIGTLVVVILKAQHLPNKQRIGKQDPYCCVSLDGVKRRTRAIKRGGQHCEWDEEVRFTLYEDTEDILASTSSSSVASDASGTGTGTPPPLPPKAEKRKKKVRGGNGMLVACYADDPKEPELIGETVVDLTEVLTKGETDEWFTLQHKDKFSGEVYLELTFWSNEKPPEKKSKSRPVKANKQYGGPGTFVPSDSESSFGSVDSRSSIPNSLRTTSSLAQLDLYNPPYERTIRSQGTGASLDQIADEFGGLSVSQGSGGRRRESYPPPRSGHTPRPADSMHSSFSSVNSYHSGGYVSEGYSESGASYGYENPSTPVPRNHPHHHRHSFGEPGQQYPVYQSPYDPSPGHSGGYSPSRPPLQSEYGSSMYSVPTSSSGFSSISTPTPSGFAMPATTPVASGFMTPGAQTPAPSGFVQHPAQTPVQYGYGPPPTHTPAPSGFMPPSSSMGYHQQPAPIQTYPAYQHYPPQSTSAPPMMHQPGTPSSVPTPPHSAPPPLQQYPPVPAPSPSHSLSHMTPQQYPSYAPSTPSPPQQYNLPPPPVQGAGSRPLPMPGRPNGSYPVTPPPPHVSMPPPPQQQHGASPTHPSQMVYSNTPPHMQPQPQQQQSHPLPTPPGPPSQPPATAGPPPVTQQPNGFVPPPPPPPINSSRLPGPPPAPPSQMYQQQQQNGSGIEAGNGRGNSPVRPPLPQPPVGANPNPSGFQPPPMPPPLPSRRIVSTSQNSLPQPPSAMPQRSVRPGEIFDLGPPPRPPAVMYNGNSGFWNYAQPQ